MGKADKLTLAFINKRPAVAARVFASLPANDAASFIDSIPTRYAVQLVSRLNARDAAAILKLAGETTATAVVREMDFSVATAIFRQLPGQQRQALLSSLPRRQMRSLETTLAFAPDTVGAHMSTTVDVLASNDTVADALRLKTTHRDSRSTLTFVVNEKRALIGIVPLLTLLRYPETTPLSELADLSIASVSPQMRLSQLEELPVAHRFGEIPVITRRGEPMGVIFSDSFARGGSGYEKAVDPTVDSLAGSTLQMMGQSLFGLTELLAPKSSDRSGPGGSNVL